MARQGRGMGAGLAAGAALILLASGCGEVNLVNRIQARLQLKEGNLKYLDGDYNSAISHYDQAIDLVPTLARAYLNRAYSNVAMFRTIDDFDKRQQLAGAAVESFKGYLRLMDQTGIDLGSSPPSRDRIEQHILTLYLDSQQQQAAVEFLEARLAKKPRDIPTIQMLGNIYADRGDVENAVRWHRRRIEMEPDNAEAYYALGVFAWQVSYYNKAMDPEKRAPVVDEGLQAMLKAVELRSEYFEALTYINLLYREKAKYAEKKAEQKEYEDLAKQYLDRALEVRKAAMEKAGAAAETGGPQSGSEGGAPAPAPAPGSAPQA